MQMTLASAWGRQDTAFVGLCFLCRWHSCSCFHFLLALPDVDRENSFNRLMCLNAGPSTCPWRAEAATQIIKISSLLKRNSHIVPAFISSPHIWFTYANLSHRLRLGLRSSSYVFDAQQHRLPQWTLLSPGQLWFVIYVYKYVCVCLIKLSLRCILELICAHTSCRRVLLTLSAVSIFSL